MANVVTLIGIDHGDQFEHRQDRCAVSMHTNGSLVIDYLDRNGHRITSCVEDIHATSWKNLKVNTLNSVYHFEIREGKYDAFEIESCLLDEKAVNDAIWNALGAFAKALA